MNTTKKHFVLLAVILCIGAILLLLEPRFAYPHSPQAGFTAEEDLKLEGQGRRVEISFDYERQSVLGSNQIAVWIEDMQGTQIKTICVTSYTAIDGWLLRKTSLPQWRTSANPAELSEEAIDAVSGATPKTDGRCQLIWDLTDEKGEPVPDGRYRCYVEGTLHFFDHVIYCAEINTADGETVISPIGEYTNSNSPYRDMLGGVKISYYPQ